MAGDVAVRVQADVKEVAAMLRKIERKAIPGAAASSITSTIRKVRKSSLIRLRAETGLPAKEVNKRARIRRAKPKDWRGWIWWNLGGVNPAAAFKAKQTPTGVRAGKSTYPKHFLGKGKSSGKQFVFRRLGKKPYPIAATKINAGKKGEKIFKKNLGRAGGIWRRTFIATLNRSLKKRGHHITVGGG